MPTEDDPLEAQQALVETALELVFATYDDAVAQGVSQTMVVLVDCEDQLGSQIARAWLGDDAVDDAIANQEFDSDDQTTVFARAVAWRDTGELVEAFPYLKPAFRDGPPEEGVFVVSITAGGASALTAPWEAREST